MLDTGIQARITKPPEGPGWEKVVNVLRWKGKGVTRCEARVERKLFEGGPELDQRHKKGQRTVKLKHREEMVSRTGWQSCDRDESNVSWSLWSTCKIWYRDETIRTLKLRRRQGRQGIGELRVALCCGCYRQSPESRLHEITRNHINELTPFLPLFGN